MRKTKKTLANINKFFNGKNDAIKFVDNYGSIILAAKRKVAGEEPETKPSKVKAEFKQNLK